MVRRADIKVTIVDLGAVKTGPAALNPWDQELSDPDADAISSDWRLESQKRGSWALVNGLGLAPARPMR